MTIPVEATYANGVLRPEEPLPLAENEKVRVTIAQDVEMQPKDQSYSIPKQPEEQTLGEWIAGLARDFPPEVLDRLPTDGASQHNHYIYGTPKRTDLPE